MKNIPRIIDRVLRDVWAITPSAHEAIRNALEAHLDGNHAAIIDEIEAENRARITDADGVAVIPVFGLLGKHLSLMEMACGGCDVDAVGESIDMALADDSIHSILMHYNSAGGVVTGIPELADKIKSAGERKPTVSFTDDQCCSAAYWLARQANHVFATPSSEVGSIGVYIALLDETERLAQEGVKIETFSAGEFKLAGASFKGLTDQDRQMFQADVDKWHAKFKSAILGKREVAAQVMEGQTFDGEGAVNARLVDGLCNSLDQCLAVTSSARVKG